MKIMVIGGGGREHAIIKKLKQNPLVEHIFALPGNGGIAKDATCVPIAASDIKGAVRFAKGNQIDFAVVAPDDPLVLGMVDALHEAGILSFGPNKRAAIIEGSKVFAKDLMQKYGIPTAAYRAFSDQDEALSYLDHCAYPVVVKADGLALGKGVLIAENQSSAAQAVRSIMQDRLFGASGERIVIEEFLTGPEVSVLAFTDGIAMVPMVSSMDHKRALDFDLGLNTGGMGAIAPNPFYTPELAHLCMNEIFLPTMRAMNAEGRTFQGCLYFGLMLTENGPKVIEYNCRFGDPETQVVLPLLETDLLEIMMACERQTLSNMQITTSPGAACCVIVASGGYPLDYKKGCPIRGADQHGATIYHSGTQMLDGQLVTSGGRVLGAVAAADNLGQAIEAAYAIAEQIEFEGAFMRHDIGKRALEAIG